MTVHKFNYQVITQSSLSYEPWVTGHFTSSREPSGVRESPTITTPPSENLRPDNSRNTAPPCNRIHHPQYARKVFISQLHHIAISQQPATRYVCGTSAKNKHGLELRTKCPAILANTSVPSSPKIKSASKGAKDRWRHDGYGDRDGRAGYLPLRVSSRK